MRVGCVIVAAGRGERAGLGYNKILFRLNGKSVISTTIEAVCSSKAVNQTVLVINPADEDEVKRTLIDEGTFELANIFVHGGATRSESVKNGLRALSQDTDIVLIHDGARPFVTKEIIDNVIRDAAECSSGVICCPVTDTVKYTDGDKVETLDRSKLYAVQTPQAFSYQKLLKAYDVFPKNKTATDDATVFEYAYGSVRLTRAQSASRNRKLTTPEDFESMPEQIIYRCGTGYDVHRLVENRDLILCGVKVPYEKGLLGHSDADVALHALMDAMLGAAALGDIGKLFPDTDDAYRGISSMILLKRTYEAVTQKGYRFGSCDITIVCQRPKLAPFIEQMRRNIASALNCDIDRVSVKATTTERLGFEGEGLGISAQAAVMLTGFRRE